MAEASTATSQDMLDETDAQNITDLHVLFEDLDISIISAVYLNCGRDRHEATQELGDLVQNPQKLDRLLMSGAMGNRSRMPGNLSNGEHEEDEEDYRHAREHLPPSYGSELLDNPDLPSSTHQERAPAYTSYDDAEPPEEEQVWPNFALGDTLTDVGTSLAEGVTHMANNITGWVADLVSAGWGEEEDDDEYEHQHRHGDAEPTRGYGGSTDQNMEHLHHRRGQGQQGLLVGEDPREHRHSSYDQDEYSEEESELDEEEEEEIKKDA